MHNRIASCRDRLTRDDFDFITKVLSGTPESQRALSSFFTDHEAMNLLLDNDRLFRYLLESTEQLTVSPNLYFYILVRHALIKLKFNDRDVADYVAAVLCNFIETKNISPIGELNNRSLFYVIDYLEKISKSQNVEKFYYIVHLADLSLFISGLFPDFINNRENLYAAPGIGYYDSIGQAHYALAKDFALAKEQSLEPVFASLSDEYIRIREALNLFQDEFVMFYQCPNFLKLLEDDRKN